MKRFTAKGPKPCESLRPKVNISRATSETVITISSYFSFLLFLERLTAAKKSAFLDVLDKGYVFTLSNQHTKAVLLGNVLLEIFAGRPPKSQNQMQENSENQFRFLLQRKRMREFSQYKKNTRRAARIPLRGRVRRRVTRQSSLSVSNTTSCIISSSRDFCCE